MVIPAHLPDWQARIAELERRVAADPHGPTWFWKLQVKILTYLVARYAGPRREADPSEPAPPAPPVPWPAAPERSDLVRMPSRGTPADTAELSEHARRRIREITRDLHEINSHRRAARGIDHSPDLAWEWWKQTFAR